MSTIKKFNKNFKNPKKQNQDNICVNLEEDLEKIRLKKLTIHIGQEENHYPVKNNEA